MTMRIPSKPDIVKPEAMAGNGAEGPESDDSKLDRILAELHDMRLRISALEAAHKETIGTAIKPILDSIPGVWKVRIAIVSAIAFAVIYLYREFWGK